MKDSQIAYRFVRMGQEAPEKLPPGEIWVDVGGRADSQVLDHHREESRFRSAAELLVDRAGEVQARLGSAEKITVVTHEMPDLDAIGSAWLAGRIIRREMEDAGWEAVRTLVGAISDNDQGICLGAAERWWPVVFRIRLNSDLRRQQKDSLQRLRRGLELVEETFRLLEKGKTLEQAAESLIDRDTRRYLIRARADYDHDLQHSLSFQVELEIAEDVIGEEEEGYAHTRTALVDALYLPNPRCVLFKEMARTDQKNSTMGHGFPLLVVSRPLSDIEPGELLPKCSPWRFIISVDPLTGLQLPGLGARLEEAEKEKDRKGLGLRCHGEIIAERKLLGKGEGRFGLRVASPWYDGRGHGYTIIDSPSFELNGRRHCGSSLTYNEVLEIVWNHGSPARLVPLDDASLTFFVPVQWAEKGRPELFSESIWFPSGEDGQERRFPQQLADELSPVLRNVLGADDHQGPIWGWRATSKAPWLVPQDRRAEVCCVARELWEVKEGMIVWMARFQPSGKVRLHGWNQIVADLRRHIKAYLGDGISMEDEEGMKRTGKGSLESEEKLRCPREDRLVHLAFCQNSPRDLSIHASQSAVMGSAYLLAEASPALFSEIPGHGELEDVVTVDSHDSFFQALFSFRGVACFSMSASQEAFFKLRSLELLVFLALAQRSCLDALMMEFTRHRYMRRLFRRGGEILEDRMELLKLEQSILFDIATEHYYGQRFFAQTRSLAGVEISHRMAKEQIESLAAQVNENRQQFVSKVLFWLTVFFGPFTLVEGLFSGIHMDRNFAVKYKDPMVEFLDWLLGKLGIDWVEAFPLAYKGWVSLLSYLIVWVVVVFAIGVTLRLANRDPDVQWNSAKWLRPRTWRNLLGRILGRGGNSD